MKNQDVTIAIVCLNEEKNIKKCLNSLITQEFKPKEILIIDNGSTDKTQEIIRTLQERDKNVRLLINPKRSISTSRNIAIKNTKTPLLAFIDADCIPPKNWLKNLLYGYAKHKADDHKVIAVGGSNIPPKATTWYKILGLLLDSFLGTGKSVQGRIYKKDTPVPHLPCVNVLYEKEKIEKVGGFDESFGSIIEDEDLSTRLRNKGYKFVYLANAPVTHYLSPNLKTWLKKMFTYGKGRSWFVQKYPNSINLKFLTPIALLTSIPFLLFFPIITYIFWFPYLLVNVFFSFVESFKKRKPQFIPNLFSLYILTHLFYGFGELYGLFARKPRGIVQIS